MLEIQKPTPEVQPLAGGFVEVNRDWQYAIKPNNPHDLLYFDPQEDGTWLAHKEGGEELRILQSPVVVKLLNEALAAGCIVGGFNLVTRQKLIWHATNVKVQAV